MPVCGFIARFVPLLFLLLLAEMLLLLRTLASWTFIGSIGVYATPRSHDDDLEIMPLHFCCPRRPDCVWKLLGSLVASFVSIAVAAGDASSEWQALLKLRFCNQHEERKEKYICGGNICGIYFSNRGRGSNIPPLCPRSLLLVRVGEALASGTRGDVNTLNNVLRAW